MLFRSLGTLVDGPPMGVPNPAIIDEFEGTLIAIGTPAVLGTIETVIETWKKEKSPAREPAPAVELTAAAAQPSLAEVADAVFGQAETEASVEEPNAIEAVAAQPEPGTSDVAPSQPDDQRDPAVEFDPMQDALRELQRQTEQAGAAEDPEAAGDQLRAALEQLLRSAQAHEQQAPTSVAEEAVAPPKPAAEEVRPPQTGDTRIVTRPDLTPEQVEKELEVTINLAEEVDVEKLLELVGKQLGLNYMYDRTIFAGAPGKVMLSIHDGVIKVGDLYSLLESVLRFRGFVMTRRDRLVTIVRQQDIATVDPVLRMPDEAIQPGDVMVSSIFELQHINPQTAQTLLTQMRMGTSFNTIAETGTLIVTDYAFRMERIRELIAMIDVAGAPKDFQFRQLRYMQAADLVPKVKALSTQIRGVSVSVGSAPAAAPPAPDPRTLTPAQRAAQQQQQAAAARATQQAQQAGASQETVYLEADERTNRVLMIGYAEEIQLVNQLIDSLDVASYDLRFVKEYIIQYVEATDVVTVLNELGLARVTVSSARQQPAARQPAVRPGQQLTPQQQAQLAQQQQQQQQQQQTTVAAGSNDPYISLRAATNSLLVNASEEQHKAIELIISHVDVMQKDQRMIREYEIQYVDTQSILDTLGELGIITPRTTTPVGAAGRASAQPQQAAWAQGDAGGSMAIPTADGTEREITAQEPQIAVLGSTNSLLVHATPRQHSAIAMVIAHADRQLDRMVAPYVVYALENQDPTELAEILNKLITETVEESAAARTAPSAPDARIQTRPATTVATLPSGEEQRIRIIPDPKTYSLVVYANKRNQQWVGELVRELDAYRPQVLLDVTLVEITKDDDFNYALNVLNSIPDLQYTSGLTGGDIGGRTKNEILTDLLAAPDRSQFLDFQSNRGSFTGFYGNDQVMALLTAMQTKKYGRIMANPKLLVNDNEAGTIETKTTTYITRTTTNFQQTQSGDPIQTTTTDFDPYDASIRMDITPRISKGDNLRLEITLNRSDFLGFDPTSQKPPNKAASDVATVVTVPDGYTIILGGMDKVIQSKGGTKVPILGDLPLIGGLFRSTSNISQENKLYVFVKANILRPGTDLTSEDLKDISSQYQIDFEEQEAEMQRYEDWPGIKPQPMTPERVLKRGN